MPRFEWNKEKEKINIAKHGLSFSDARRAFDDPNLIIDLDKAHSAAERRYHAYGWVKGNVMTVRFTYRSDAIRIFGAAYWRKGKKIYEKRQKSKE